MKIAFDAKFPTVVNYFNPIVGVLHHKRDTSFNFVLQNGDRTEYPCVDIHLEETRIPDSAVVRKVRLREFRDFVDQDKSPNMTDNVSPRAMKFQRKVT